MLEPIIKEVILGTAEILTTFNIPKIGTIAGCMVRKGKILRNSNIRVIRDNVVIAEDTLKSLKRFKDDAKEVREGFECGLGLQKYNDLKIGDFIESYIFEEEKQ
jgi:translation initiation factor IF-2